jgi:biopolymer transport protein TolR
VGASLTPRTGSRNGGGRRRSRPMSEINVTPMVDVMLVLLIVFMVAAPLMTVGVPVDLPKIHAKALESKTEPIVVSINKEGQVFLKDHETTFEALLSQLRLLTEGKPDTRIYLRGDKDISYGAVMAIMGRLNAAGIGKVALVTELPQAQAAAVEKALTKQAAAHAASQPPKKP